MVTVQYISSACRSFVCTKNRQILLTFPTYFIFGTNIHFHHLHIAFPLFLFTTIFLRVFHYICFNCSHLLSYNCSITFYCSFVPYVLVENTNLFTFYPPPATYQRDSPKTTSNFICDTFHKCPTAISGNLFSKLPIARDKNHTQSCLLWWKV